MKVITESDRIRLIAETNDENDAIISIDNLMAAARYDGENSDGSDGVCNDFGCFVEDDGDPEPARNYCCIPLPDDADAHAVKTGGLVMEPTEREHRECRAQDCCGAEREAAGS